MSQPDQGYSPDYTRGTSSGTNAQEQEPEAPSERPAGPPYAPPEEAPREIRYEGSEFSDKFVTLGSLFQVFILVGFAFCMEYEEVRNSQNTAANPLATPSNAKLSVDRYYSFFQDMQMMVFAGYAFVVAWLKKCGYSSVGFSLFIGAMVLQLGALMCPLLHHAFDDSTYPFPIKADIVQLVYANFCAAAVLISFGALVGKVSPLQLVVIAFAEAILYAVVESLCTVSFKAVDQGGSIIVHVFGCYFGLAVSYMIPEQHRRGATGDGPRDKDEDSVYRSDFFSIIGTAFLWVFFPSFNAGLANGNAQARVVVNTVLALAGSCTCTFYTSRMLRSSPDSLCAVLSASSGKGKLSIRDIQSATIAGGVAASSVASQFMQPWVAVVLGMSAGFIATVGHVHIQGRLLGSLELHDTTGVHNRHGMPAVLGAVVGIIYAANAGSRTFGEDTAVIFPEMANGRETDEQALKQLAALGVAFGIAVAGGLATGLLVRMPFFEPVRAPYLDDPYWVIPGEEDQYPSSVNEAQEDHEAEIEMK